MKQLTEIRYNPIEFPKEGKENTKGHELIFLATRLGYNVGLNGEAQQVQESHVWRCMATEPTLANAALNLLHLLGPEMRGKVLEVANKLP